MTADLPDGVRHEALRLTRLARRASDDRERDAYRRDRDEQLAVHGYTARIRTDDDTLVLYPDEWLDDGEVQLDQIEDTTRAYELSLSGPGDPDDWESVAEYNRDLVAQVRETHGDRHGDNARSFAEFMSNHYARRMETASPDELREFLTEYYPRNAWHDDRTRQIITESLEAVFQLADRPFPLED